ncbi:Phytochrome-like protein cph2 [Pseudoalteromonas sp. THAF3]|uniref:EAL domain-containing protein n=1 Tax=Pseudoalteromonas sp. THAF3 TaxID=2587843 RepID=UPI001269460F|nr:EAL domain-containing protein [Pseudoalteromonas sp. THAF3]QFU03856.1 Phytochrome-like protein cph2 [Pseudoalteromonas sp. THAF3]
MQLSTRDYKVKDAKLSALHFCMPHQPAIAVIKLMRTHNVSAIAIREKNKVIGIWTESDCVRAQAHNGDVLRQPIRTLMSTPVHTISDDSALNDAANKCATLAIRHLIVVADDDTPLGLLSLADIVGNQGLDHYLNLKLIGDHFDHRVPKVQGGDNARVVAQHMAKSNTHAVLVEQQQHVGIITATDVLEMMLAAQGQCCWPFASKELVTVSCEDTLLHAYRLLHQHGIRHLLVTASKESQRVKGVLTLKHINTEIESAYLSELEAVLAERDCALQASQKDLYLANKIIAASLDGIMITDAQGTILQVNPAFTRLTGYSAEEVLGKTPRILSSGTHDHSFYQAMWQSLSQQGVWQGEICNRRKDGDTYVEWLTIIEIKDKQDSDLVYAGIFTDITERKASERKITKLAYFDDLTGLPNRRLFKDRLSVALAHGQRQHQRLAIMFIDLDHFKGVNDSLGHSVGDELLKQVAKRLQRCVRSGDTLARLGGDEFTLLLNEVADIDEVIACAEKVLAQFKPSFSLAGQAITITTSIGIAIYPDDGESMETLLKHADVAMYRSKDLGRNSYQLFKATMNARSLERLTMSSRIKQALVNDEFELFLQPIVDCQTTQLCGAEALLRWQDPQLGMVAPGQFIPLAEELGLIIDIDKWVITRSCALLAQWQQHTHFSGTLSINLSAAHLCHHDLVDTVTAAINEHGVSAEQLEIEITESSFISSFSQAREVLLALKLLGVKVALDDFGTGYSALSYLTKLPIDKLKVDSSFIAKVPDEYGNSEIVSAIIAMASSLNLLVVAEGVEKPCQHQFLQGLACDYVQGFLLGEPCSITDFNNRYVYPCATSTS